MADEDDFEPGAKRPRNMPVADFNEHRRRFDLKKAAGIADTDKRPRITKNYEALVDAITGRLGVSFSFDTFASRSLVKGLGDGYDGELSDAAVSCLRRKLILACVKQTPGTASLTEICLDLAHQFPFHPVKDRLAALKWDGIERPWLHMFMGAEDTLFNAEAGLLWMTAAVRRIMKPGCKFDHVLILQGKTGTGKSSACRSLSLDDEWFSDSFPSFDDERKQVEALAGKWIVEYPDLAGMRTAEGERIKAFVSRQVDRARPAYGRLLVNQPRQCVFIGTTEENQCLNDLTNRRFWPVECGGIRLVELQESAEQLWAEAVAKEGLLEPIVLSESLWSTQAEIAQNAVRPPPYVEEITKIVGDKDGAFPCANLREWLGIPLPAWPNCKYHAGKAIKFLGFVRVRLGKDSHGARRLEWVYVRNRNGLFFNELETIFKDEW